MKQHEILVGKYVGARNSLSIQSAPLRPLHWLQGGPAAELRAQTSSCPAQLLLTLGLGQIFAMGPASKALQTTL